MGPDERVVVFNTGAVQKYTELLPAPPPRIEDPERVDWELVRGNGRYAFQ